MGRMAFCKYARFGGPFPSLSNSVKNHYRSLENFSIKHPQCNLSSYSKKANTNGLKRTKTGMLNLSDLTDLLHLFRLLKNQIKFRHFAPFSNNMMETVFWIENNPGVEFPKA